MELKQLEDRKHLISTKRRTKLGEGGKTFSRFEKDKKKIAHVFL